MPIFSNISPANKIQGRALQDATAALITQLFRESRALTFRRSDQARRKEREALIEALEDHATQMTAISARLDVWDATKLPDAATREEWLDGLAAHLRQCGRDESVRGNAWQFAAQLARNFQETREWYQFALHHTDFPNDEGALDDADKTVFRPYFPVTWDEIAADECSAPMRETLQLAAVAGANFRFAVREALEKEYGLRALKIVPKKTTFDVRLHETTPLLTLDCERAEQDNIIFSVERHGYEVRGEVIRRALVRRWRWSGPQPKTELQPEAQPVPPIATETAPVEDWRAVMEKGF